MVLKKNCFQNVGLQTFCCSGGVAQSVGASISNHAHALHNALLKKTLDKIIQQNVRFLTVQLNSEFLLFASSFRTSCARRESLIMAGK